MNVYASEPFIELKTADALTSLNILVILHEMIALLASLSDCPEPACNCEVGYGVNLHHEGNQV